MTEHYTLKDGIGTLDAESDAFLRDYFLETQAYSDLLSFDNNEFSFKKRVIVGRTGSGKTALLSRVSSLENIKSETVEAESMILEHIKNNVFISTLIENKIDIRIFYKTLWLHILLTKVLKLIYPKANLLTSLINLVDTESKLATEYVNDFGDSFFNDNIVSEITNKLQSELSASIGGDITSLKANLGGKDTSEITEKIQSQTSRYVNAELLSKQKQIIQALLNGYRDTKRHYIISIDDLDRSWLSSSEIRYDFINALLDAFRELINIKNIKILISIRTDILKGVYNNKLRQEEKDRSLVLYVDWKRDEILQLLDKRIGFLIGRRYTNKGVTFRDLFNFQIGSTPVADFILERTMLRPRDAIEFVNICLDQVSGDVVCLNENIVLNAEETFYSSRKSALCTEWYSLYPNLRNYLDVLSVFNTRNINLEILSSYKDEISEILLKSDHLDEDKIINECVSDSDFKGILNIWFICGVIGKNKTDQVIIYSNYQKLDLDETDFNKDFLIHPLFFRN